MYGHFNVIHERKLSENPTKILILFNEKYGLKKNENISVFIIELALHLSEFYFNFTKVFTRAKHLKFVWISKFTMVNNLTKNYFMKNILRPTQRKLIFISTFLKLNHR